MNGEHYIVFLSVFIWKLCFISPFFVFVMCTSMKMILFKHFKELLRIKIHLRSLLWVCKSHPICDLRPPVLVSHIENLEKKQLWEIEGGIYELQLELEVNLIKQRRWVTCLIIFIMCFHFTVLFAFTSSLIL